MNRKDFFSICYTGLSANALGTHPYGHKGYYNCFVSEQVFLLDTRSVSSQGLPGIKAQRNFIAFTWKKLCKEYRKNQSYQHKSSMNMSTNSSLPLMGKSFF